ncbi:MAG: GPR endopeptidase [Oscillospiraceae bacterium]|nr:GPR endopeptidase [Oscillospiraceae bacterium]
MQKRRTDLAVEARDLWTEAAGEAAKLEGVKSWDALREGYPVTTVEILDENGAKTLEKPVGTYVTISLGGLRRREEDAFGRAARVIAKELGQLLPSEAGGPVLVAGLGNQAITPDAIGPLVVSHILATRHLVKQMPEQFGAFRPVAAIAAGVLGTTGVESGEIIKGVAEKIKPSCILVADALTARTADRICSTVQITNSGITPGSGVGNSRRELNAQSMGVPVIAIGVPTVVEAGTLAADLVSRAGMELPNEGAFAKQTGGLLVTPKDIDAQAAELSKVIGYGINLALQKGLALEDITMLLE